MKVDRSVPSYGRGTSVLDQPLGSRLDPKQDPEGYGYRIHARESSNVLSKRCRVAYLPRTCRNAAFARSAIWGSSCSVSFSSVGMACLTFEARLPQVP